jgi:guanylate kinase
MNKTIVTITGPSASGKSTLEKLLCSGDGVVFDRVVSATTRAMRAGEKDGVDYRFVSKQEFGLMEAGGELAETNKLGSNFYGAQMSEFERIWAAEQIAVIVVDPNGRRQILDRAKEHGWSVLGVFVTNPPTVRYERLLKRFLADVTPAPPSPPAADTSGAITRFAERLAIVAEVESHWGGPEEPDYELRFDHFNEKNTPAVISQVTAYALNLALKRKPGDWANRLFAR